MNDTLRSIDPIPPDALDHALDALLDPRTVAVSASAPASAARRWAHSVGASTVALSRLTGEPPDGDPLRNPIDLAVIGGDDLVVELHRVATFGARLAIIAGPISSLTGRAGRSVVKTARTLGVRLLGPGIDLEILAAHPPMPDGSGVALVTRTARQARPILAAERFGTPFSRLMMAGDELDVSAGEIVEWLTGHATTSVITLWVDPPIDGAGLTTALDRAATAGIPTVCHEIAAPQHSRVTTGAVDPTRVFRQAVAQFGGLTAPDASSLRAMVTLLHRAPPPRHPGRCRVEVLDTSRIPDAPAHRTDAVRCRVGGEGDDLADTCVRLIAFAARAAMPVVVVWDLPTTDGRAFHMLAESPHLTLTTDSRAADAALDAWRRHHESRSVYRSAFGARPRRRPDAADEATSRLRPGSVLTEVESKAVLRAYEIPITRDILVSSADLASKAARNLGEPVVMKIASPDIAHKSDLGLVHLGVSGGNSVRAAFDRIVRRAAKRAPGAHVDGVLVCETAPSGIECVVRVERDPVFGLIVVFGLGGAPVELFGDVSVRVPPFDRRQARSMIEQPIAAALLRRGPHGADVALGAVVDVIMKLQQLAVDHFATITEIDLNPLIVSAEGAMVLDAVLVCG